MSEVATKTKASTGIAGIGYQLAGIKVENGVSSWSLEHFLTQWILPVVGASVGLAVMAKKKGGQ